MALILVFFSLWVNKRLEAYKASLSKEKDLREIKREPYTIILSQFKKHARTHLDYLKVVTAIKFKAEYNEREFIDAKKDFEESLRELIKLADENTIVMSKDVFRKLFIYVNAVPDKSTTNMDTLYENLNDSSVNEKLIEDVTTMKAEIN